MKHAVAFLLTLACALAALAAPITPDSVAVSPASQDLPPFESNQLRNNPWDKRGEDDESRNNPWDKRGEDEESGNNPWDKRNVDKTDNASIWGFWSNLIPEI
ncbi:hypothetical protein FBU30_006048 [Linnemannia zychae]|nr:hypothetical protein FBU30_006048 [Linnemannia zychae]